MKFKVCSLKKDKPRISQVKKEAEYIFKYLENTIMFILYYTDIVVLKICSCPILANLKARNTQ